MSPVSRAGETSTATKPEKHSAGPKGKKGAKDTKDGRTSKAHPPTANSRPGSQVIERLIYLFERVTQDKMVSPT